MEGWSELSDGPALHGEKTVSPIGIEFRFDECTDKLRGMFDDLFSQFSTEKSAPPNSLRPFPVLGADGVAVDLFKLFWVVKKYGGYDAVGEQNLWESVIEQCGVAVGSVQSVQSVQLVYDKYLREFENWACYEYTETILDDGEIEINRKLESFVRELEMGIRKAFPKGEEEKKMENDFEELPKNGTNGDYDGERDLEDKCVKNNEDQVFDEESTKNDDMANDGVILGIEEVKTNENGVEDEDQRLNLVKSAVEHLEKTISDVTETITEGKTVNEVDLTIIVLPETISKEEPKTRKRVRDRDDSQLIEALKWLKNVAVFSGDFKSPEFSKLKKLALEAREARLVKRNNFIIHESSFTQKQKKPRMDPSWYKDDLPERVRSSQRKLIAPVRFRPCSEEVEKKQPRRKKVSSEEDSSEDLEEEPEKRAIVPVWTGRKEESDSKWLGTVVWTPQEEENTVITLSDIQIRCDCIFPGSIECNRKHVTEKRLKLKMELKDVFYEWGFDTMGEEVSLTWKLDEEIKFGEMMKENVPIRNKIWVNAFKMFKYKTSKEIISYYFNVYMLQRRSYQNRVMPREIDSDDDEKEVQVVGEYFGYKALKSSVSVPKPCVLNEQCLDFDD